MAACRAKGTRSQYDCQVPDRFSLEACEDLFYQMVRRLKDAGELSVETVFIDGTKLEACANKYTFVWKNLLANGKKDVSRNPGKQYCS